ncbi:MAG TPA: ABC transporter permease [bacterium]|nr:ABC transporter permease [bacterium]
MSARALNLRIALAGTTLALLVVAAAAAPWLAPADPLEMGSALLAGPSAAHPLGTDSFGRDTLSRLLFGARVSLLVAATSVLIASSVGTLLGIASATYRGAVEWAAMRAMDLILAFPPILLAIAAVTFLGQSLAKLAVIVAILYIPTFARLSYGGALGVAQREYVEAARALGGSVWHQMGRHILPNVAGPLIVQCSLSAGFAILVESGLSFLGLGVLPPAPTWGRMVSESRDYMQQEPMLLVWPSLAIAVAIGAFNMLGDGLRDALDPRAARSGSARGRRRARSAPEVEPARGPAGAA